MCGLRVQVQYSMLDRRPENDMAQFCEEKGIKLLPYGVVAGGLLSERYLGMPPKQCAPFLLRAVGILKLWYFHLSQYLNAPLCENPTAAVDTGWPLQ